ncbi:MAG: McrB family protein [Acidibrevibacterium sp.]|uniref:McrB family protein n=1 Tax=Acidibrevibacterium sp. TaxID=2606776 RepID=UPI003D063990
MGEKINKFFQTNNNNCKKIPKKPKKNNIIQAFGGKDSFSRHMECMIYQRDNGISSVGAGGLSEAVFNSILNLPDNDRFWNLYGQTVRLTIRDADNDKIVVLYNNFINWMNDYCQENNIKRFPAVINRLFFACLPGRITSFTTDARLWAVLSQIRVQFPDFQSEAHWIGKNFQLLDSLQQSIANQNLNHDLPQNRSIFFWWLYEELGEIRRQLETLEDWSSLLEAQRQIIFTGPPGTGKTLSAKRLAAFMLNGQVPEIGAVDDILTDLRMPFREGQPGAWDIVQFHPSYNYDDFVRGIRIRTENGQTVYTTENGPLLEMAAQAQAHADRSFILIIDEINRANVAAVLGEMIYALEYRGQPVRLQYGDGDATARLPANLYIIGTMNTADRSIGHIDYAVRRRFAFVPLLPDRTVVGGYHGDEELRAAALRKFDAVANLFNGEAALLSADYRAEDVQPGHSYFLAEDTNDLNQRMKYQVGPLLREYVADGVLEQNAIQRVEQIENGA